MSETDAIPRKGQIGTAVTATIDEPDPNNPGQFLIVDLTLADPTKCFIEFKRPDDSTFQLPAIIFGAPTNGQLRVIAGDIFNQVGIDWEFRGIAGFSNDDSVYPGSWTIFSVGT